LFSAQQCNDMWITSRQLPKKLKNLPLRCLTSNVMFPKARGSMKGLLDENEIELLTSALICRAEVNNGMSRNETVMWFGLVNLLPVYSRGPWLVLLLYPPPSTNEHPFWMSEPGSCTMKTQRGQPTSMVCLCCSNGSHQGMLQLCNCYFCCAKEAP